MSYVVELKRVDDGKNDLIIGSEELIKLFNYMHNVHVPKEEEDDD